MMKFALKICLILFCSFLLAAKQSVAQPITHHHLQHLSLPMVNGAVATHTAIADGSWFAPGTWDIGGIPGEDARVVIPAGRNVVYNDESDARIHTINVAGNLSFATDSDSSLLVDTLYVDASGELIIGTVSEPVLPENSIDITIVNNGDIDVSNDPNLLSRGIVAFGRVSIHGARKATHLKLAEDTTANATSLQLASAPEGWRVGDTLVLTGTRYSGWKWDNSITAVRYHGTQDEVLTITNIDGNTVSFTPALQHDHLSPRADLKASVANFSRNITFATQNPETAQVHQRGHMVIMHHDDADVRYAAFNHMGRTDKSVASFEVEDIADVQANSNVRGRYPFHVHRSGIDTPRSPAIAVGLAVFNSPGWGITHHDSNMVIHNSATFDTFGAGIVAETGNEIGSWTNNIAIRAEGNSAFNPKNGNDREAFDMGRSGAGFWFQGRMVRAVGNVAASVNHGYVYLHRGSGMLSFPAAAFMLPEALRRDRLNGPDDAPIFNFHNNEAFASTVGVYVVKANPNQGHDIRTLMTDFTGWEVRAGAAMEYTSHYLLQGFDLIGSTPEAFRQPFFGIDFGTNTTDMTIRDAAISGFEYGVGLGKDFTNDVPASANQYVLIDVGFNEVSEDIRDFNPALDQVLTAADLSDSFIIDLDADSYSYNSPATSAGSGVLYTGTKTDSIDQAPIPAGTDEIGTPVFEMIAICEQEGYRTDSANGDRYIVVEEYFTDRASGQIEKTGIVTRLGSNVVDATNNQFTAWGDCIDGGEINLTSRPPSPQNDEVTTMVERSVLIDVLANDTDLDGDTIAVDGIVQPLHGEVFLEADGRISYQPDFDFRGYDHFDYWATDRNGHFQRAVVNINVVSAGEAELFTDGFE